MTVDSRAQSGKAEMCIKMRTIISGKLLEQTFSLELYIRKFPEEFY